jgi:hypothetical protein
MGTAKVKSGSKDGKVQYPYDAMVYKDGTVIYAVDKEGNVIKRGIAGTDDSSVIQAAIDTSTSYTLISNGNYTIIKSILIQKNNYKIDFDNSLLTAGVGIGSTTAITSDPFQNQSIIIVWKSNRVIIENVRVDCNNIEGSCGILAYGRGAFSGDYLNTHITIRDCECYNAIEYLKSTLPTTSTNGYGIFLYGCVNSLVENCYLHDNPVGIFVHGYLTAGGIYHRNNSIVGCKFYDNDIKYVKYLGLGIYAYYEPGLFISKCDIRGDHRVGIWLGEGKSVDKWYTIEGCYIENCWNNGIHLGGIGRYSIIRGNVCHDCGNIGIAPGQYCTITNNLCYDNGSLNIGYGAGIYMYGFTDGCIIEGNHCYDSGVGYQKYGLYGVESLLPPLIVGKNNFIGCEVPYLVRSAMIEDVIPYSLSSSTTANNNSRYSVSSDTSITLTLPTYSYFNSIIEVFNQVSKTSITTDITISKPSGDFIVGDGYTTSSTDGSLSAESLKHIVFVNRGGRLLLSDGKITDTNSTSNLNGGTINWADLSKLTTSNDTFCTATSTSDALTYRLVCKKAFSIPTTATIKGIIVGVGRISSHKEALDYVIDNEIRLIKADGSLSATNLADVVNKWETGYYGVSMGKYSYFYGNDAELWGETWTPSDVNGANFGVVVAADIKSSGESVVAKVDSISIYVVYESGNNIWYVESETGLGEVI